MLKMELKETTAAIKARAKKNSKEVRDCTNLGDMKGFRQGDLYVIKYDSQKSLEKIFKKVQARSRKWEGFKPTELINRNTNQLVLGDTKGARHIIAGDATATFYKDANPCLGGIVEAKGPWALTHPEHANGKMGAGNYIFFYQMDARLEGIVRRVMD